MVQPTQDRTAENASRGEGVGEVAFDNVIMADERITMSWRVLDFQLHAVALEYLLTGRAQFCPVLL